MLESVIEKRMSREDQIRYAPKFLGLKLSESPPEHSSSRTGELIGPDPCEEKKKALVSTGYG